MILKLKFNNISFSANGVYYHPIKMTLFEILSISGNRLYYKAQQILNYSEYRVLSESFSISGKKINMQKYIYF